MVRNLSEFYFDSKIFLKDFWILQVITDYKKTKLLFVNRKQVV